MAEIIYRRNREVSQALKGIIVCYFKSMSHEHMWLDIHYYLVIEEENKPLGHSSPAQTYHQHERNPNLSIMLLLKEVGFPRSSKNIGDILQYSQHRNIDVLQTER